MTTLDFTPALDVTDTLGDIRRPGVVGVRLHDNLWRITRSSGDVLGYVERFQEPRGHRFRAKRLNMRAQTFAVVGEFWRINDAIDSLRFG